MKIRGEEVPDTQFMFEVGLAMGGATERLNRPRPTLPSLEPGQRMFQVWSEPDWMGNRYLLTFELKETPVEG